jgi:hypothetical protein
MKLKRRAKDGSSITLQGRMFLPNSILPTRKDTNRTSVRTSVRAGYHGLAVGGIMAGCVLSKGEIMTFTDVKK